MKKLLKKQMNFMCKQCKKEGYKKHAEWRESEGFTQTMCQKHKNLIIEKNNEYYTEADYQTWMK